MRPLISSHGMKTMHFNYAALDQHVINNFLKQKPRVLRGFPCLWCPLTLVFLSLLTLSVHAQFLPQIEFEENGAAHLRGELLVQFKPGATDEALSDAFARAELKLLKHVQTPAMKERGIVGITRVATSFPLQAALRLLNNSPAVEFAEPNRVYQSQLDSNDPSYLDGSLWGVYGDDLGTAIGPTSTTNPFGSQV